MKRLGTSGAGAETPVTFTAVLPREALTVVAPPPALLSQRNVEAHTSIPRSIYLDLLPAFREAGGEVSSVGKLRLVDREAFVAWLRTHGSARRKDAVPDEEAPRAGGPAATLAAELGLVRRDHRGRR